MSTQTITLSNQPIKLDYHIQPGKTNAVICCLHGLWGSREDFSNIFEAKEFQDYTIVALDFPGHGNSEYIKDLAMDDLAGLVHMFLLSIWIHETILVGHSMGGLVGLLYTYKFPSEVRLFVNIEGSLSVEDWSFSRYIHSLDIGEFQATFSDSPWMKDCSTSMIDFSENGNLMKKFESVANKSVYIYGSKSTIPYLEKIESFKIPVIEITESWHHPFLEDPKEFCEKLRRVFHWNYPSNRYTKTS